MSGIRVNWEYEHKHQPEGNAIVPYPHCVLLQAMFAEDGLFKAQTMFLRMSDNQEIVAIVVVMDPPVPDGGFNGETAAICVTDSRGSQQDAEEFVDWLSRACAPDEETLH